MQFPIRIRFAVKYNGKFAEETADFEIMENMLVPDALDIIVEELPPNHRCQSLIIKMWLRKRELDCYRIDGLMKLNKDWIYLETDLTTHTIMDGLYAKLIPYE